MSPTRRRALQLVAAGALPTAGCLDRSDGAATPTETNAETVTETSSPSPTETVLDLGESFESPDGTTVTVKSVDLRRLVRSTSVGSSTHIDVAWLDGYQFAVADVELTGSAQLGSDVPLALEVDGTRYPLPDQHWYRVYPPGTHLGSSVDPRPAYPAPVTDASSAAVVWPREKPVRWRLPEETVEELARAPSFAVESFTAPESVSRGASFEASFTVSNAGADGWFVAEFGAGPLSDHGEVTVDVPAGSERTHRATMEPYYPEGASTVAVTLDWGKERHSRTVAVE